MRTLVHQKNHAWTPADIIATDTPGMDWDNQRMRKSNTSLVLLHCTWRHKPLTASDIMSLSQDLVTTNGMRAVYATVEGVPYWRLLPHLWVDKTVKLHWNSWQGEGMTPCSALKRHNAC